VSDAEVLPVQYAFVCDQPATTSSRRRFLETSPDCCVELDSA